MTPGPGADDSDHPRPRALPEAAGDFASSITRFFKALVGLFGFELREAGLHFLVMLGLVVAVIMAVIFAYLFLLLGLTFLLVAWLGGGWPAVLLGLFAFHLLLAGGCAAVLWERVQRPLFPAIRHLVQDEMHNLR